MLYEYFVLIAILGSFAAGLLGSLTGLGGGVVIIPLLSLGLGVDLHYAIGASLIAVIATSSGSASAYVKEGISNIRIGLFLTIATTVGAIAGAFLTAIVPANIIAIIFSFILMFSVAMSLFRKTENIKANEGSPWADKFKLGGSFTDFTGKNVFYSVKNVFGGFFMMIVAGIISGLLGIGSGALKVIAMDNIMKIPFKVSTTTSNFMIGITAAASAVVYFQHGYIKPGIAGPVMIGVILGAITGSKILVRVQTKSLKWVFAVVVTYLGIQMLINGLNGNL